MNVLRVTATSPDFVNFYAVNKKKYGIPDGFITPELTESFAMEDYVGLFGSISDTAIIYNFKLDKVEVKTHIDATVGIICGYVDAMVFNVGVYNGIITAVNGAVLKSDYSILGAKSARIVWEDMPEVKSEYGGGGSAGGVIRVDVSDYLNYTTDEEIESNSLIAFFPGWENVKNKNERIPLGDTFNDISTKVPDAVKNRVFLVRSDEQSSNKYNGLSVSQLQGKGAFHIYTSPISSRGEKNNDGRAYDTTTGQRTILGTGGTTSITSLSNIQPDSFASFTPNTYAADYATNGNNYLKKAGIAYNADFYNRIANYASKPYILKTGTAPIESANIKGTGVNTREVIVNGTSVEIPTNGVWFKPMAAGPCIISFGIGVMSNDETRSIYRFKRDSSGNIIEWTETVLLFSTGTFGNTDVVAFQYDIEPEDVNEQYEFFIGTSAGDSGNDALGFVFLAVAGASNTSGPTTDSDGNPIFKQALYDVNYVVSLQDDMTEKEYKIHQTILRVNSYAAPVGSKLSLYYLAKTVQNDAAGFVSRVFYYSPDSNKIIDITVAQQSKDSQTKFADRETVAEGSG